MVPSKDTAAKPTTSKREQKADPGSDKQTVKGPALMDLTGLSDPMSRFEIISDIMTGMSLLRQNPYYETQSVRH
jgi:hypothetical protein